MNRYDLMKASTTSFDEKDNQPWPDVLSVDYNDFVYRTPPTQFSVDDTFLISPFIVAYAIYQISQTDSNSINQYSATSYDDIILNINKVPHVSLLNLDEIIKFPVESDILKFATKKATNGT